MMFWWSKDPYVVRETKRTVTYKRSFVNGYGLTIEGTVTRKKR